MKSPSQPLSESSETRDFGDESRLRRRLLRWFDRHRRPLPWRRSRDPYAVLVSEVMLQQTRVTTVERYFEPFLEAFPDVEALARASEDEVLARWSGLGYYSRARRLRLAAQAIVARGSFPHSSKELRNLPGVGDYTASAVASIAFGEAAPVLDGNVERVLSRVLRLAGDPKRSAQRSRLLEEAGRWLEEGRPGDSNQALMELGATLCLPKSPRCEECPIVDACRARLAGDPESLPEKRPRRERELRRLLLLRIESAGAILLARRPRDADYLPELWELPGIELSQVPTRAPGPEPPRVPRPPWGKTDRLDPIARLSLGAADRSRWSKLLSALETATGGIDLSGELHRFRHAITYRDFEVAVLPGRPRDVGASSDSVAEPATLEEESDWTAGPESARFVPRQEVARLPVSALVTKALSLHRD